MESCPWSSILYFSNVKAHVALVLVTLIVSSLMMEITVFLRTLHVSEKHPTHQHRTVCGPDGWKHAEKTVMEDARCLEVPVSH